MIGRRRSKSPKDLSANSIATRTAGKGRRRRIDFCSIDLRTEIDRRECFWTSRGREFGGRDCKSELTNRSTADGSGDDSTSESSGTSSSPEILAVSLVVVVFGDTLGARKWTVVLHRMPSPSGSNDESFPWFSVGCETLLRL